MGATPIYALPYPDPADPADVPADMKKLADRTELILGGAVSTTPPASPAAGELWVFPADPANGVLWMFRYVPTAATYKWSFVGGGWLTAFTAGASPLGTAGAWTGGVPQLTIPRSGLYLQAFSSTAVATAAPATVVILSTGLTTAAAGDTNLQTQTSLGASESQTMARPVSYPSAFTGGQTLQAWYWANVAGTQYAQRFIAIQPVCVS